MKTTKWINASKELPPEGRYVLVHHTRGTWIYPEDQLGVEMQVARLVRGISIKEREQMKAGTLPDPEDYFLEYNGEGRMWEHKSCKRSRMFHSEDEYSNNKLPYIWQTFGNTLYGQEIDYWMPIDRYFE